MYPQFCNVGYPLKLTKTVFFDLCLFLHCTAAVCTSCTMMFVQRPYQMQMTRQVWRRQRPAAACCHCCSAHALLHTVPLLHCTRGRLSLGPGPVLYPATPCHMAQDLSQVQKLKISFAVFLNQASLSVCGPWHIRL